MIDKAGEDRDLCDRLIGHGYRLIFVPDALVRHAHFLTFRAFCRQHFNYGWGAYRLHQVRAKRAAERIRFEPLEFHLKMIAYPFTQTQVCKAGLLAMLLGLAQAANATVDVRLHSCLGRSSSGQGEAQGRRQMRAAIKGNILEAYHGQSTVVVSVKRMLKFLGRTCWGRR